jgi:hypothetical protein
VRLLLDGGQCPLGRVRVLAQLVQADAGLDGDRRHRVRHDIVQLAGDPEPLLVDGPRGRRCLLGLHPLGALGVDLGVGTSRADQLGDGDHHGERERVEEQVAQCRARDRQVREHDQGIADDDGDEPRPSGVLGQDRVRRQRHTEAGRGDVQEQGEGKAGRHHREDETRCPAAYGEGRAGAHGDEVVECPFGCEGGLVRHERLEPQPHQHCCSKHIQRHQVPSCHRDDRMTRRDGPAHGRKATPGRPPSNRSRERGGDGPRD